jgi:CRP-like cAMP-binding protein
VSGAIDSSKTLDSLQTGTLEILSYYMNPRNLYRGNGGGYFILDILGSFPVDAVVCSQESSFDFLRVARAPKILKAVRLIRVLRLMRLARVSRIVGKFKDKLSINPAMFAITAFLTLVVVATHWLGCLFFFIGTTMDDEESVFQLENPSQATWSTAYTLQVSYTNETDGSIVNGRHAIYCLRFNGTQLDEGCLEAPTMDQYIASVYWAVASLCTVGYGDVRARTTDEFAVAIFVMLAGGFCFAYMVGGLSVMLERVTTKNKELKDKLYEVDGFVHREKLPKSTTREIRKHLTKTENNKYHIPSIIRSMHGSIKNEMFLLLYEDLVRRVPFFQKFSDRAIVDLVTRFEYVGVPAGETIYRQGSIGEKIYFLRSGTVRMSMGNTESRAVTWQVQAPGFFGEKCLSDHNKFRLATAETVTWCNCFMLRRSDIQDTCNRYPDAEIAVAEFKQKFESRWRKAIGKVRGQIKLNYASRTEAQVRSTHVRVVGV